MKFKHECKNYKQFPLKKLAENLKKTLKAYEKKRNYIKNNHIQKLNATVKEVDHSKKIT